MRLLDAFAATAAALTSANVTDELCCVFQREWTRRAWGDTVVARAPLSLWHLFADCGDPWGPVTACEQAGIAKGPKAVAGPGDVVALAPGWNRVQGWRGRPFEKGVTGHTISVFAPSTGSKVLVFDSAKDRNEKVQWVVWTDYAKQFVGGQAACALVEPS